MMMFMDGVFQYGKSRIFLLMLRKKIEMFPQKNDDDDTVTAGTAEGSLREAFCLASPCSAAGHSQRGLDACSCRPICICIQCETYLTTGTVLMILNVPC